MIGRRAALALPLLPLAAHAQSWPERPLRLVVPYAPGGTTDVIGRAVAEGLGRQLGQAVVVENRPGANTIIGAQQVAQAVPDGYTLLLASGASLVLNPLLYRRMPYDAARDLAPLGVMVETPLVMVTGMQTPATTVAEFIAWARSRPGGANYATVGRGNPVHLAAEVFASAAGLEMTNVVYAGSAPSLLAIAAGDVQVMFDLIGSSLPLVRDGRLRALAVTTEHRLPVLPAVPTVAESGFPGYRASTWFGVAVASGAPAPVQARLRAALATVLEEPGFRSRFEELGLVVHRPRDPAGIQAFLAEEAARWSGVIRTRGITLD